MNYYYHLFVVLLLLTYVRGEPQSNNNQINYDSNNSTSLLDFDINQAYTQLMYAYTAYCPKEQIVAWSCYFCKYNLTDTSGFSVKTVVSNELTNTFGYVGAQGTTVEVVFRGTQPSSLANWIADFDFAHSKPYPDIPNAYVHSGFLDAYNAVKPAVHSAVSAVVASVKATRVIFTGHSLGAALATLCAIDVGPTLSVPYLLYNFGSPRVGNQVFSDYFYGKIPSTFRVVNKNDIVPHLPMTSLGFHHVAQEVWWNKAGTYKICDKSGEDPTCADSILLPNIPDHLDYLQINLDQGGC